MFGNLAVMNHKKNNNSPFVIATETYETEILHLVNK